MPQQQRTVGQIVRPVIKLAATHNYEEACSQVFYMYDDGMAVVDTYDRRNIMAELAPTQGRYLAFIHAYTNSHGVPPAESEIATAMCVSPPSVNQMVKTLERKGLILRRPGQPRSLQVLIPEDEAPAWGSRKPAANSSRSALPDPRRRFRRRHLPPCTSCRSI